MNVAVVIPIYKEKLAWNELISLEQCLKVLNKYKVIFIAPENRTFSYVPSNCSIMYFPEIFFSSLYGYNSLMINPQFYMTFLDYDYILIYQLDAFVFSDKLQYFCELDYDYIGAPWPLFMPHPACDNHIVHVGNGGLSLRKVKSFANLLSNNVEMARSFRHNEDVFFAYCGKIHLNDFKSTPIHVAHQFSFEISPKRYYIKNKCQLPFGCHAWEKYDREFYTKVFRNYGYDLMPYWGLMSDVKDSFTSAGLVKLAVQRLFRRINNKQSILKYLPKEEPFFVLLIGVQAQNFLKVLLSEGLKISNPKNILLLSNDNDISIIVQIIKSVNERCLIITENDDLNTINKLNMTGGVLYQKDYISFWHEYFYKSLCLVHKITKK